MSKAKQLTAKDSPLGKPTQYTGKYSPKLLVPILRRHNRSEIGIAEQLPFYGVDVWNLYEISYLNQKGKPIAGVAQVIFPCESAHLIESKSFKLYLNSFNQTKFDSKEVVQQIIEKDLSEKSGKNVEVMLFTIAEFPNQTIGTFASHCIDDLDIDIDTYHHEPKFLSTEQKIIEEKLHSNLLKSNCLITGQPDWGSVEINYSGKKINHEGLLRYIVSFRTHNEFHEPCVERMFMDIMRYCKPDKLTVEAHYTRRGGLDICPIRSTEKDVVPNYSRLIRQ